MSRSPRNLLTRVLDTPALVEAVQSLEPRVLGALVERVGVEDSGELVAMATTDQLLHLFDESLWKGGGGAEERFDPARFGTWLEVMLEAGDAFVARRLTELPEDLVFLAFHTHLWVLDAGELATHVSLGISTMDPDELERVDKALDASLVQELDDYLLVARRHDGWDAIVTALLALDRDHHDYLERLLARCHHASTEHIEDNGGLYAVLTSEEMLESDAAADREDRRAREGFVSAASARAFLELARTTDVEQTLSADERDPIARAYFRELEDRPASRSGTPSSARGWGPGPSAELLGVLRDEGILERAPRFLPASGERDLFRGAMLALLERDPELHARRMEELAFLANVLLAGPGPDGRRYRSVEAVETVVAVCNRALEHVLGPGGTMARATDVLVERGADVLFRAGWRLRQA